MRAVQAVFVALLLSVMAVAPAAADEHDSGKYYYLNNELRGGEADQTFAYGREDDQVLVGDWDGNGTDTLGVRRGATYYLSNTFKGGEADVVFTYGRAGDEVVAGDWDGDGVDSLAVRRGRTFYVTNRLRGGEADETFIYGRDGDVVLVGDWDGDGQDSFGVRRGHTYYLNNELRGGKADETFIYGRENDQVYAGNWDGRAGDTLGVRRGATYYLNNALRGGAADEVFTYGRDNDVTLIGDWDGDGDHTLGVRRTQRPATLRTYTGAGDDVIDVNLDGLGPAVATMSHTGSSNFSVWTFDSSGSETELLVNEIGNYSGTVAANFGDDEHRGFDIDADGDWTIEVKDAPQIAAFSSSGGSGSGDDVRRASRLAGEVVAIEHNGSSNFAVWAVDGNGNRFALVVNEIGSYSGSQRIPSGTAWLEITADGSWSFTG